MDFDLRLMGGLVGGRPRGFAPTVAGIPCVRFAPRPLTLREGDEFMWPASVAQDFLGWWGDHKGAPLRGAWPRGSHARLLYRRVAGCWTGSIPIVSFCPRCQTVGPVDGLGTPCERSLRLLAGPHRLRHFHR